MSGAGDRARTVLVTGAAGFIGSTLCPRLAAAGYRVVGYDDLSRGRREYLPPEVRLVEGDVRDALRVRDTVAGVKPDWLIHLAAMHFIPDCLARPRETMDVNVEGTRHVLDACRHAAVGHVTFASTAAVYAPTDLPCVEDITPLQPMEVYGESKLAAERVLGVFHGDTGIPVTILRMFNAIGRRETNPHLVPEIFEALRTSDVITLGNLEPRRDYIDSRDVADAILSVAGAPGGIQVFNVGTGVAYSVRELVDRLEGWLGRPLTVHQDPARMRPTERQLLVADIDRIRRATQWTPRISVDGTFRDLIVAYGLRTNASERREGDPILPGDADATTT